MSTTASSPASFTSCRWAEEDASGQHETGGGPRDRRMAGHRDHDLPGWLPLLRSRERQVRPADHLTQRANLVAGCDPNSGFHKSITEYFNTACFVQPLAGQFGNTGRDILRGPGINNWDMGIGKDFRFTERVAFQFRAEAFNLFNHAQYGYDPTTGSGIGAPIDNNPNDTKYGRVTAARPGRIIQLGGKIVF